MDLDDEELKATKILNGTDKPFKVGDKVMIKSYYKSSFIEDVLLIDIRWIEEHRNKELTIEKVCDDGSIKVDDGWIMYGYFVKKVGD